MSDISAYDWVAKHAASRPQKLAVLDDFSSRRYSYAEFHRRIGALAQFMRVNLAVAPGERVATLAHNSTNILEVQFACMRIGAIMVPINVRLAVPEVIDIIADCSAKVLLHDREFASEAKVITDKFAIKTVEMDPYGGPCLYEEAIATTASITSPARNKLTDCWTLIYTSGTTGRPKGVMVSYQMVLYNAINYGFETGLTLDSHGLTFLPMFHISGLNLAANPCLLAGASVTVMRRFEPARALQLMKGVTHVFGVPANYLFIRQLPEFADADLSGIRSMGVGGAPMPIPLLQAYADKGVAMQQAFGMTETGPTATILSTDQGFAKQGSAGLPVVHMDVLLTDEKGCPVERGEIGELRLRGPSITTGYWNRPDESAQAFDNGWFRTGDLAYQDEDGYFYIVERLKNMFISGGENVYPAEVEKAIERLDCIGEVAVIAEKDEKWGEVGHAFVVVNDGVKISAEAIIEHCNQQIARYKVPKYVTFLKALPRNATGKVDRRSLRTATI